VKCIKLKLVGHVTGKRGRNEYMPIFVINFMENAHGM